MTLCPTCGRRGSEREWPVAMDHPHRCKDSFHDRADYAEEMYKALEAVEHERETAWENVDGLRQRAEKAEAQLAKMREGAVERVVAWALALENIGRTGMLTPDDIKAIVAAVLGDSGKEALHA